jgi:hypothetical protein
MPSSNNLTLNWVLTNNLTWLLDVIVNIVLFGNAPLFWNVNIYVKVSMTDVNTNI